MCHRFIFSKRFHIVRKIIIICTKYLVYRSWIQKYGLFRIRKQTIYNYVRVQSLYNSAGNNTVSSDNGIYRHLGLEGWYLPLCRVADTSVYYQGTVNHPLHV